VGPKYFETLQTPLLLGREFIESDQGDGLAVVIVNEALANRAWPGEDPVGKPLGSRWSDDAQVVGLVADSKYADVREDALPIVYRVFKKLDLIGGVMQVRFADSRVALNALEQILEQLAETSHRIGGEVLQSIDASALFVQLSHVVPALRADDSDRQADRQ